MTSYNPLKIYMFENGLARFATEIYSKKHLSKKFVHLTNFSINKKSKNYVKNIKDYQENKTKLKQTYELLIDLRKKFLNDPSFRQSISTTCCLIKFETQTMR